MLFKEKSDYYDKIYLQLIDMGGLRFIIALYSSVGSYYTYGVTAPYSVFDEYPGSLPSTLVSLTCTLSSTLVSSTGVSLDTALLIIRYLYHLSKTLTPSLW